MKKVLVVIDVQNDFVSGALGSPEAMSIVPNVVSKIKNYQDDNSEVYFTLDTHPTDYLNTQEGKNLPVEHCIKETEGWNLAEEIKDFATAENQVIKYTFGSKDLAQNLGQRTDIQSIEIIGLVTDICVVSNALMLKSFLPETPIMVDAACCAGTSTEMHNKALEIMTSCQVQVINKIS